MELTGGTQIYTVRVYEHKNGTFTLGWALTAVKRKNGGSRWRNASRVKLAKALSIERN